MMAKRVNAAASLLFLLVVSTPVMSLPVSFQRNRRSLSDSRPMHPDDRNLLDCLWRLQHSIAIVYGGAQQAYVHFCDYNDVVCDAGRGSEHFQRPSVDIRITQPSNHPSARQAVEDYYKQLYDIIDRYADSVLTVRSLEMRDLCSSERDCVHCSGDRDRGVFNFYCSISRDVHRHVLFTKTHITKFLDSRGYQTNSTFNLGEMALSSASDKMEFQEAVLKSLIEDSHAVHEELWKLFTLVRDILKNGRNRSS